MRTAFIVLVTLLAALPRQALGQQATLPTQTYGAGSLDLGLRFTDISGDEARFQRFRDLGNGGFIERFRFQREGDRWLFDASADHVGRLDQRISGAFHHNGRLQIRFQWDQVPLFISRDTRTLYSAETPGTLRIADGIQQGIQSGQLRLADVVSQARAFDTQSRRDVARFNVLFSPRRDVDVKFDLTNTLRDGTMPWGIGFASTNFVEVAAPIDTRTTDVATDVAWTGQRASARVGYEGSWFHNAIPTLVLDNPLVFTDSTQSSQARSALPPDSTLHTVSTTGGLKLPAGTHVAGSISVGTWRQNDLLLPFTINTALAPIPLDRATADAKARTLAMSYNVTSRPAPYVWLNGRFRYYDFDNRTPAFHLTRLVIRDQSVVDFPHGTQETFGYTRRNLDVDASLTPVPFSAIRVGYSRDWNDRTNRIFARTTEDTVRASIDSTQPEWLTARAIVERSQRTGSGFEQAILTDIGEQPGLRHFDIADRDRNRVTGLVQINPTSIVGLSASAAVGHDDYRNSGFGLRDSKSRVYSTTVDLTPGEAVAAGLTYSYERYTALQNSRNASSATQFVDPTRNWANDSADTIHTVTTNVDLLRLPRRSEVHLSYDLTRSRATYVYVLPSASPLAAPAPLPPVLNDLHMAKADFRIPMNDRLAIGVSYWYERYKVDDFALGQGTIDRIDLPGGTVLGSVYRPYTANSGWARLIVTW